jgi:Cu2+-exporting ATPase
MSKIAVALAIASAAIISMLALQDPLAAASLTPAQRAEGFLSTELVVNGEDCRFCRINVERALKEVPGVRAAKADMHHHRARVVYDPRIVQPDELAAALRFPG